MRGYRNRERSVRGEEGDYVGGFSRLGESVRRSDRPLSGERSDSGILVANTVRLISLR